MKTLTLEKNAIKFSFNSPIEETGFIKETFDFQNKPSYATIGITELLQTDNSVIASMIVGRVFRELQITSKVQNLDYLQVVNLIPNRNWFSSFLLKS
jgi:hypothetical protein